MNILLNINYKKKITKADYRIVVILIYTIALISVMCFHEPWFDEAESWLIARDSSIFDLLFVRPHYEGHPATWWLLLAIPAKLGVPYEIGLKGVNLCTSIFLVFLFEFYAPFSKKVKALFPFTYFIFYQYGVTSRPYELFIAFLFLIAINYRQKDTHPIRFTLCLFLLCIISAYGIVLAGGVAIAWTLEFWKKDGSLIKDKARFFSLFFLAVAAFVIVVQIFPASNATGAGIIDPRNENSYIKQLFYFWFIFPSELFFTNALDEVHLITAQVSALNTVCLSVISSIIWAMLIFISKRRSNLGLLLIPYTILSFVGAKYFSVHHIGILFGFLITVLWIDYNSSPFSLEDIPKFIHAIFSKIPFQRQHIYTRACQIIITILPMISIYWSLYASIFDITHRYSSARTLAKFINEYKLENYNWMSGWELENKNISSQTINDKEDENIDYINHTHELEWPLIISNPYFKENLIENSYKNYSFSSHEDNLPGEAEADIAKWRTYPEPDFFVCQDHAKYIFSKLGIDKEHYTKYFLTETNSVWKDKSYYGEVYVYIRNDIYKNILNSPDQWSGYE